MRVRGLLAENGDVLPSPASTRGLVISRALCRFRRFVAPAGLTRAQRDRAALLYAEAHAPFAKAGWLAMRTEVGAEIWYWDGDRLPPGALTPAPESVWRDREDGWRIVRCIDGYEAEYRQGGALLASTWRREAFDRAAWISFVASVDDAAAGAPETAPEPKDLALTNARWRARTIKPPLGWRDLELGAWSVVAIALALSLFFTAQSLHHQLRANAATRDARQTETHMADEPDLRRARDRQALALAFSEVVGASSAALVLAETLGVLDGFAIEPRAVSVEDGELRVRIDQPEQPVRAVVQRLQETGRFCSVIPEIVSAGVVELRATVRVGVQESCDVGAGP
jgi:hypothetical protein